MTPVDSWTFRREIQSDTSVGSGLVNGLIDEMTRREWPATDLFRTQLAYEEAIVNAIRHGNRSDEEKKVVVEMVCGLDEVSITITDEGEGFDPSTIPDPRSEELLEVPGGRGVLLITEIMDDVQFNDRGNQIRMLKRRSEDSDENE
ncbi:MAG: ATP-binding protein [Planctomycetota bacterium]